MKFLSAVLMLAAFQRTVNTAPAGSGQCPLVFLSDDCSPDERKSVCWSPGEPDADCVDNDICCFDGCSNQCGMPKERHQSYFTTPPLPIPGPPPTTPAPTTTTTTATTTTACPFLTVIVTLTENIEVEMCQDIPAKTECLNTTVEKCADECRQVQVQHPVQEEVEECKTVTTTDCVDKPCQPIKEQVPSNTTKCLTSPRKCRTVPVPVCKDVEVEKCTDEPKEVCKMVPQTESDECGQEKKCEVFWAPRSTSHHGARWKRHAPYGYRPYYPGPYYPGAPYYMRPTFYQRPSFLYGMPTYGGDWCEYKRCCWLNKGSCIVEECSQETETTCKNITSQACDMEPKETCIEARETCETKVEMLEVESYNHCPVTPEQVCTDKDEEKCEMVTKTVQKTEEKTMCQEVCQPTFERECKTSEPSQECRMVPKTMSYQVPKRQCS